MFIKTGRKLLFLVVCLLSANTWAETKTNTPYLIRKLITKGFTPPHDDETGGGSTYNVTFNPSIINIANQTSVSFALASGTSGATYTYAIDDNNPATAAITNSGTLASASQTWNSIDISSLDDGMITLALSLEIEGIAGDTVMDVISKDTTSPAISILSPTDDATDVWTTASLAITFSEDVAKGSGDIVIYNADGTEFERIAVSSSSVSIDGNTATINPATEFTSGNSYYVNVDIRAFTDASGNPEMTGIAGATTWNFTATGSAYPIQIIPTYGARGLTSFDANGQTYAMIANLYNMSSHNINSRLYRFVNTNPDNSKLAEIQSIPTNGAHGWESFVVDGETYVLVENYSNGSSVNINSKLYRFVDANPDSSKLVEIQSIATNAATDWESFVVGGETYLLVANHYNGSSYNIASKLYRFINTNPDSSKLVEIQSITTSGALYWESFVVGGETYLLVANHYNGSGYNTNSRLYRFVNTNPDNSKLVEIQAIATNGATNWKSFVVGGETYLLVANCYNGSSYNINSKLYRFVDTNPDSSKLVEIQSIATNGAQDWESFVVGGETYLLVANYYNNLTNDTNSHLYRFATENPDSNKLIRTQDFPTKGAADWNSFSAFGSMYLLAANYYSGSSVINSHLYRFQP